MPYYPYENTSHDHETDFLAGVSQLEKQHIFQALGVAQLSADDQVRLKTITGCSRFMEFRERVLSPHQLVDHEMSLVLLDEFNFSRSVENLHFRALHLNSYGKLLAVTTRTLERNTLNVKHNLLFIPLNQQDKGLASVISQSHEDAWEAAYYKTVTLQASVIEPESISFGDIIVPVTPQGSSGRVYWAQSGYDFDSQRTHEPQRSIRLRTIQYVQEALKNGRIDEDIAQQIIKRQDSLTPWDIESIVENPTIDGKNGQYIGRRALNARDWFGRKELNEGWHGNETAMEHRLKYLEQHPYIRKK